MNYKHDKEKVIAVGMELFWNNGFHNLGVDQICKETGMTKGAFYNAFKSKEKFLLTTIEAYGDLIVKHLQNQLKNTSSQKAFDKLIALYSTMLSAQTEYNFKGCLVNNTMSELGALNPLIAETAAHQFDRFISVLEPVVQKAQKDNDLTDNVSAKILSEIIHTTFFGFLTRAKSTKESTHKLMILFLKTLKP